MQYFSTAARLTIPGRPLAYAAEDQHRMIRGVINGVILSFAIWVAAGWLVFSL